MKCGPRVPAAMCAPSALRSLAVEWDAGVGSPTCQAWPACSRVGMWGDMGCPSEAGGPLPACAHSVSFASGRIRREVTVLGPFLA